MEAFFREVAKQEHMPRQNAQLFRKYGMELMGPPLAV
jgi:hypothetical protein